MREKRIKDNNIVVQNVADFDAIFYVSYIWILKSAQDYWFTADQVYIYDLFANPPRDNHIQV